MADTRLISARAADPRDRITDAKALKSHAVSRTSSTSPHRIVRYCFYAFIFSLLFEGADVGFGTATMSRLLGFLLVLLTPLSRSLCYRRPPKAFWYFAFYLLILFVWGAYFYIYIPRGDEIRSVVRARLFTFTQLMVLFWLSYNLLRSEKVVKGTLWALATACLLLAVLQIVGVTSADVTQGRETAFDENPNIIAAALSTGILAFMGIAYGYGLSRRAIRIAFWLFSGVVFYAIVRTGSRGALVALVVAFLPLLLQGRSFATKIKLGLILTVAVGVLAFASFQIDAVRVRWENTFQEGDLAGRGPIYEAAWQMFLEKPIIGWGTMMNSYELGTRMMMTWRDTHNLYLWVLTETGIVGAIPFFLGLWFCWRSAWKARRGVLGVVPLSMLTFILIIDLKATMHNRKLFWVTMAYSLAASTYPVVRRQFATAINRINRRSAVLHPSSPAAQSARRSALRSS